MTGGRSYVTIWKKKASRRKRGGHGGRSGRKTCDLPRRAAVKGNEATAASDPQQRVGNPVAFLVGAAAVTGWKRRRKRGETRGGGRRVHIPDGFLDTRTWVTTVPLAAGAVGYALRRTRGDLEERQVPFLGVTAAFIFAAQMINFPVAGGTSGHLIGAVLAAVLLGPWNATVAMAAILVIQSLFFQDGGITALGANILNMAVLAPWAGYTVYRLLAGLWPRGERLAIALAGWFSVLVAALAASLELAAAGTVPLAVVLPAMLGWHALIGVGEGLITIVVVSYARKVRPELAGTMREKEVNA